MWHHWYHHPHCCKNMKPKSIISCTVVQCSYKLHQPKAALLNVWPHKLFASYNWIFRVNKFKCKTILLKFISKISLVDIYNGVRIELLERFSLSQRYKIYHCVLGQLYLLIPVKPFGFSLSAAAEATVVPACVLTGATTILAAVVPGGAWSITTFRVLRTWEPGVAPVVVVKNTLWAALICCWRLRSSCCACVRMTCFTICGCPPCCWTNWIFCTWELCLSICGDVASVGVVFFCWTRCWGMIFCGAIGCGTCGRRCNVDCLDWARNSGSVFWYSRKNKGITKYFRLKETPKIQSLVMYKTW